jgi:hypothetical protein
MSILYFICANLFDSSFKGKGLMETFWLVGHANDPANNRQLIGKYENGDEEGMYANYSITNNNRFS